MHKLKKGDKVKVLLGKDKGREGTLEKVDTKKGLAVIPGVNMYKKHTKGYGDQKGGIFDIARPLQISKVGLVCPKCGKLVRIGFKFVGEEKKRICKKCGREIDTKEAVKKKKK